MTGRPCREVLYLGSRERSLGWSPKLFVLSLAADVEDMTATIRRFLLAFPHSLVSRALFAR